MRSLFKADLKRILRDKLLLIVGILAVVFGIVTPVINYAVFSLLGSEDLDLVVGLMNAKTLFFSSFSPGNNFGFIMPILMSIIICKDYSQGTIRNKIICGKTRSEIYFSSLITSTIVIIALVFVHALLTLGCSLLFFEFQAEAFTISDFTYILVSLLFEIIIYVCISTFICFLCVFANNVGVAIVLYIAISLLMSILGSVVSTIFMFSVPEQNNYPILEFLTYINFFSSTHIGSGTSYILKEVLYTVVPPIVCACGFTFLGIRKLSKKDLK